MLNLPEVTIWTMVWAEDQRWLHKAGQVLRYCASIIKPAELVLFTSGKVPKREYPFRVVEIPQLDWQSYNVFVNRVVPTYLKTKFSMSVHEDGFPIDLTQWRDDFLSYDYIGAPWVDGVVGNGGFNIESRKLMDLKCAMPVLADEFNTASDRLVCSSRRAYLEERGVRFAPVNLAMVFSTEQIGGNQASFGFHGRKASAAKYRRGWEAINAAQIRINGDMTMLRNQAVQVPKAVRQQAAQAPQAGSIGSEKIACIYIYPAFGGKYDDAARKFVASYKATTPSIAHDLYIVSNGGQPNRTMTGIVGDLKCHWRVYDNAGYDIGAFQRASVEIPSELMVFFGNSTTFRRKGWLERMWGAYQKHGMALYGTMGNRGDARVRVEPHIRTTGFWMPRALMNQYPVKVTQANRRYEFEHGKTCLTGWVTQRGLKALVVTWDKEYEWAQWDSIPNGFHRGNQSGLLCRDRLTEPPFYQAT